MSEWGTDHDTQSRLVPEDEAALDALIGAGFDPLGVEPGLRERASRVASLLGLLDTPPPGDESGRARLTDILLRRVASAASDPRLVEDDHDALESFIMHGHEVSRAPSGLRPRAAVLSRIGDAVTTLGPDNERWIAAGRTVRAESVLEAIGRVPPQRIEAPSPVRTIRFADFFAAAAAILLLSAFTLPVVGSFSEQGRRRVCTANLQAAGVGLGMYAWSNNDALPMATAGFGGNWAQVGRPGQSQSANLFKLVSSGHVQPWELACPGNEHAPRALVDREAGDWGRLEEVSYSYRLMPKGRARIDLLDGNSVVLADRSPILLAGMAGRVISPETASPNHEGEGQHLLRLDDSVVWSESPVLANGDNIWLPRQIEQRVRDVRRKYGYFSGEELPDTPDDTFLGP